MVFQGPISTGNTYTTNFLWKDAYSLSDFISSKSRFDILPLLPFYIESFWSTPSNLMSTIYPSVQGVPQNNFKKYVDILPPAFMPCSKHSQRRIARLLTLPVNVIMSRLFSRHQSVCRETAFSGFTEYVDGSMRSFRDKFKPSKLIEV